MSVLAGLLVRIEIRRKWPPTAVKIRMHEADTQLATDQAIKSHEKHSEHKPLSYIQTKPLGTHVKVAVSTPIKVFHVFVAFEYYLADQNGMYVRLVSLEQAALGLITP